eukprot:m.49376 g.49376  ORF g.49376 m.49376 type:complete len:250 (+) comp7447_c2_seq1:89-838(+)
MMMEGDGGDGLDGKKKGGDEGSFSIDMSSVTAAVGQQVAQEVLKSGSESATKLVHSYARIDYLRPYFDVTVPQLRERLIKSLWPSITRSPQVIAVDMYGPVMLALSLSAILLFSMKHTNHIIKREGTVIGTSFAVSFGFWFTLSGILYAFGFVFNTAVSVMELLAVTGYSLFSYCLVLLTTHFVGHGTFYFAWLVLGTLGALNLGLVLRSRTPDAKQGVIMFGVAVGLHLLYLLYLQYAYATIYNAVSS